MKRIYIAFVFILYGSGVGLNAQDFNRPNILWITCEDISPNLGCYGDKYAQTPNLDALAEEGVLYDHAFASAPVCAIARSSIITGMHAASLGTQHMRCAGRRPSGIHMYPELLREAGYFCTNNVKTDYNFDMDPKSIWDECSNQAHWRNRSDANQPFFAIFNFTTSHESRVNDAERYQSAVAGIPDHILKKPGEVPLPPYYPDTDSTRILWARYYNIITAMDKQVGEILQQLEQDGLADNTIVLFYSDHGAGIPRHKRWLYDSGIHVPLIVSAPEKYRDWLPVVPGNTSDELVSFVDLPATALHMAGIPIPGYMQGRAFLGEDLSSPRTFVYAGRDRMDERYDMQRCVRNQQFKYIRYYEPTKPFCQYMNTPEKGAIMQAIRKAHQDGTLPEAGQRMMAAHKPKEALFDCHADPHELNNLADDPQHQQILNEMRAAHALWSDDVKDTGLIPETILRQWEERYDQSIYDIMRSKQVPVALIRETALPDLKEREYAKRLRHKNEAVRYWAAINLGNDTNKLSNIKPLTTTLGDAIPTVQLAAARALIKQDRMDPALSVLVLGLRSSDQWVRLLAAQILDEVDEKARPAIDEMENALDDENKYVVRVINRALNQLLGENNVVP